MSRPIEQALGNLIPRHPGDLPTELIELVGSLLAQSRSKCNLKPDEEVARTYVCAHLACERLKTELNLPEIEPRPPVEPRMYKKLYNYFDDAFASNCRTRNGTKSQTSTPRGKSSPATVRTLPQRQTPSKGKSLSIFRGDSLVKGNLRYISNGEKEARIPKWIGPVVRFLCHEMGTPKATPHVLAGVESLLCPPKPAREFKGTNKSWKEDKVSALVAAVWFFVVVKMQPREQKGNENMARKAMVREYLAQARTDERVLAKIGNREEVWERWELVDERDVNEWRKEIVSMGWKDMDWWKNIEDEIGVQAEANVMVLENSDDGDRAFPERETSKEAKQPRVAYDKYDYLNKYRRIQYEEWKSNIHASIDELLANGGLDSSDDDDSIDNRCQK